MVPQTDLFMVASRITAENMLARRRAFVCVGYA